MSLQELPAAALPMLLGSYLALSGLAKRRDWLRWWQALDQYRLLPGAWKRPLANGLPLAEIILGAALWVPLIDRVALLAAALIMMTFAIGIAGNLLQGISRFDCGCTPGAASPHGGWLLARAIALAVLSLVLFWLPAAGLLAQALCALVIGMGLMLRASWKTLQRNGVQPRPALPQS